MGTGSRRGHILHGGERRITKMAMLTLGRCDNSRAPENWIFNARHTHYS